MIMKIRNDDCGQKKRTFVRELQGNIHVLDYNIYKGSKVLSNQTFLNGMNCKSNTKTKNIFREIFL